MKKKELDDLLTVRLSPSQIVQLEYLSKVLNKSKSELLREANAGILKKYASLTKK